MRSARFAGMWKCLLVVLVFLTLPGKPALAALPTVYNSREQGKDTAIRNQGDLSTCWAVASATALEASLLPTERLRFSVDHIINNNRYNVSVDEGGDYGMLMAYYTSWTGPVLWESDPYGDGVSPEGLKPVKHVQEIQMLLEKNVAAVKEAVYQYGAVQTSLYIDTGSDIGLSPLYNGKESSYCYTTEAAPNHDLVIVGWDDQYPAEKFITQVGQDGAFICQNSWGEAFGENGLFYVSYCDPNIANQALIYTGVEDITQYDEIYQADLCGWTGQIGYGEESCYFTEVFTAKEAQKAVAVGFYAVGAKTEYEIYEVANYKNKNSLKKGTLIQSGKLEYAGYYTVLLEQEKQLKKGESFAYIVKITTPGVDHPVASEYYKAGVTDFVDISDGESYISYDGKNWESAEKEDSSNVCLKVYTKKIG